MEFQIAVNVQFQRAHVGVLMNVSGESPDQQAFELLYSAIKGLPKDVTHECVKDYSAWRRDARKAIKRSSEEIRQHLRALFNSPESWGEGVWVEFDHTQLRKKLVLRLQVSEGQLPGCLGWRENESEAYWL